MSLLWAGVTLLAEDDPDGRRFAGGAFIRLRDQMRERSEKLARLTATRPPVPGLDRSVGDLSRGAKAGRDGLFCLVINIPAFQPLDEVRSRKRSPSAIA
jgi:hypothetical protein